MKIKDRHGMLMMKDYRKINIDLLHDKIVVYIADQGIEHFEKAVSLIQNMMRNQEIVFGERDEDNTYPLPDDYKALKKSI